MANAVQRFKSSLSRDIPFKKPLLNHSSCSHIKVGDLELLVERIAEPVLLPSLISITILDAGDRETGVFKPPVCGRVFELLVKQRRKAKTPFVPCVIRGRGGLAEVIDREIHIVAIFALLIWRRYMQIQRRVACVGEQIIGREFCPARGADGLGGAVTLDPSPGDAFTLILDLAELRFFGPVDTTDLAMPANVLERYLLSRIVDRVGA